MKTLRGKLVKTSVCYLSFIMITTGLSPLVLQSGDFDIALAADSTSQETLNPAATTDAASPVSRIFIPEGMVPSGPPEIYHPKNVFELINGQADLYLSAGFKRLMYQRIEKQGDPEFWIEQFVYEMESVRNAFAVFSMQRSADGKPEKLVPFAYSLDASFYLAHGPYYLEIFASRDSYETAKLMQSMAEDFIRLNRMETKPIAELSLFPQENLDKNSLTLIPSNAFGAEVLNQIYTARYKLGAEEVTAFISPRKSPRSAKELALKYHEFLKDFGAKDHELRAQIEGAKLVEILDTYEMVFTAGRYLAGIHEAPSKEQAERVGKILKQRLNEVVSDEN
jgi:hypothetical protein